MLHLYLAIDGQLAAVICIADPQREEAQDVLAALRRLGIQKAVMLTGDSGAQPKRLLLVSGSMNFVLRCCRRIRQIM